MQNAGPRAFISMEIKKAVTFRASSIGDCLMGKYFLENVHVVYPEARCGIVVGSKGAMIQDLLVAYPWIEIIEVNRRDPISILRLLSSWRGSDVVLTQYAGKTGGRFSFASKLIARILARHGGLIGFADASRMNWFYDKLIPFSSQTVPAELERQALRVAGIDARLPTPVLIAPDVPVPEFSRPYLIVSLFAGNRGRGLSLENKKKLISTLHERMPTTTLFISGGAYDHTEAEAAAAGVEHTQVIAGDMSLQQMMRLIASSAGVVSVDTGMAHIAAQLGKPLVVLATCLGLHWWRKGQYPKESPITVFSRAELCTKEHRVGNYPSCINEIDFNIVAESAFHNFV